MMPGVIGGPAGCLGFIPKIRANYAPPCARAPRRVVFHRLNNAGEGFNEAVRGSPRDSDHRSRIPRLFAALNVGLTVIADVKLTHRALSLDQRRQETDESLRRLGSRVLLPGRFRRPLRLDDAILEFGCLHSLIMGSGHAAILELGCRQVNRHTRDQESTAADHHSEKSNAKLVGHRNLRAARWAS
jgi:hypothetical protein